LTIIFLPSDEHSAGFVASKQIGGAVKRNKVKRILREAYRMNRTCFKGLKVVLYAHGSLSYGEALAAFKHFREGT
jgi:ribonuclease P protein component